MYDVLSEVLSSLQLRSTVYCQSEIHHAEWKLAFEPVSGAVFHVVSGGDCWLQYGDKRLRLSSGDLVVLARGSSHFISDRLDAPICFTVNLDDEAQRATYTIYHAGEGAPQTRLICGSFYCDEYAGGNLLSFLPEVLHFDARRMAASGLNLSVEALIEEANANRQGTASILQRLANILFVQIIRAWLADPSSETRGWLAGLRDPQIASTLSAIHAQPDQDWTVATLATHIAMSRSAFAARFTELVGVTPIAYLTYWRMRLAARLLANPALSLEQVASQVGYSSDLTFSKAFRREHGTSPAAYRRQLKAPRPEGERVGARL